MKIVSWNINALCAHKQYFRTALENMAPDIFCLQEIRCRESKVKIEIDGYKSVFNSADDSKYYGTAVFYRKEPLNIIFDDDIDGQQHFGNIIAVEMDEFYVVCTYMPFSSTPEFKNLRLKWCQYYQHFVHELQKKKPVILTGDFNIVREDVDACDLKSVKNKPCYFPEEHVLFEKLIAEENLVDAYRALNPMDKEHFDSKRKGIFSVWSYSYKTRENNQGFRIDYFLMSESLMPNVISCACRDEFLGSDHCPIELVIK
jgi:exodeoxyribonuclease-3